MQLEIEILFIHQVLRCPEHDDGHPVRIRAIPASRRKVDRSPNTRADATTPVTGESRAKGDGSRRVTAEQAAPAI